MKVKSFCCCFPLKYAVYILGFFFLFEFMIIALNSYYTMADKALFMLKLGMWLLLLCKDTQNNRQRFFHIFTLTTSIQICRTMALAKHSYENYPTERCTEEFVQEYELESVDECIKELSDSGVDLLDVASVIGQVIKGLFFGLMLYSHE